MESTGLLLTLTLQQIPQQFYCLGSITKENSLEAKQMNSGLQTLKGTAWHGVNATCLLNKQKMPLTFKKHPHVGGRRGEEREVKH